MDFTDYQIYQELIKGREDNSLYKTCTSDMLRIVMEEGCVTRHQVLGYLGERFRVKMNLPEWYTNEQCANFLLEYVCYDTCFQLVLFTCAEPSCIVFSPASVSAST